MSISTFPSRRANKVRLWRRAGFSREQIGRMMGVSPERIRQLDPLPVVEKPLKTRGLSGTPESFFWQERWGNP